MAGGTTDAEDPLPELSAGIASAAANWVWLAPAASFDRAILVGEPGGVLARALSLQMGHVAEFEARAWTEALSGSSADWVVLDLDRLRDAGVRTGSVLPAARAALAGGGMVCLLGSAGSGSLASRVGADLRVRSAIRAAARAGFRDMRRYFAVPTVQVPRSYVPARRAASVAFEAMQAAESARRDRLRLAQLGLHPALYRGHVCLCAA